MHRKAVALLLCFFLGLAPLISCSENGVSYSKEEGEEIRDIEDRDIEIIELANENAIIISDGIDEARIDFNRNTGVMSFKCNDFNIEFAPDYIREYTESDELVVFFENLEFPRRTEVYTYNGVEFKIDVQDGVPTEDDFQEFLENYDTDPNHNTLEQNVDGNKMAFLVQEAEPYMFSLWQERDPEGYLSYMLGENDERAMLTQYKWINRGCGYATLCALIKCMFGALVNSVCLYCTTVSVLCAIMAIYGWI